MTKGVKKTHEQKMKECKSIWVDYKKHLEFWYYQLKVRFKKMCETIYWLFFCEKTIKMKHAVNLCVKPYINYFSVRKQLRLHKLLIFARLFYKDKVLGNLVGLNQ